MLRGPRAECIGRSRIAHAVQGRLSATASNDEVHRAVGAEVEVGHVERLALQECFSFARVARAARSQMHGNDSAVGPVENEERLAILFGEVALRPELRSRRRAEADIDDARQAVGEMVGPDASPLPPTVFASRHDVHHAGRPIPRCPGIPLHVGIVGEQLAIRIEVQSVGVPKSTREQLPRLPVGVHPPDVTAGRGGVTVARAKGVDIEHIKRHGRWKSAAVYGYIGTTAAAKKGWRPPGYWSAQWRSSALRRGTQCMATKCTRQLTKWQNSCFLPHAGCREDCAGKPMA